MRDRSSDGLHADQNGVLVIEEALPEQLVAAVLDTDIAWSRQV
jgi:hypothetical protein